MLHKQFIRGQITRSGKQAILFVCCAMLSMVTLVAVDGFSESVDRAMQADARKLHAGDIIVRSRAPVSAPVTAMAEQLEDNGTASVVRTWNFYSVVRSMAGDRSLLADLKIVSPSYPFYGRVELLSGGRLHDLLRPGRIVVAQALLDRMGLAVGDRLMVGETSLVITDVVLTEPDRPVSFFSFGPRVFIAEADLNRLGLVEKGSRVRYKLLLKVFNPGKIDALADRISAAADTEQERVETYRTANSRIKRFLENFFFFIGLVGTFTLLLAGFGIFSSLSALLRAQERTIAILKTLGATTGFVLRHYMAVVFILGLVASVSGIGLGVLLQFCMPALFSGLLPVDMAMAVSWKAVCEGLFLGIMIVALFAFLPVYRLKGIKPAEILRKEPHRSAGGLPVAVAVLCVLAFFTVMTILRLKQTVTALGFVSGMIGLVAISALLATFILWLLRKTTVRSLVVRQALRGLFRPGNATRSIIVTLTASLSFIFSIFLLEQNIDATFVDSYPPDTPNMFLLDIQTDQKTGVSDLLGKTPEFYPIIRARILSVNGRAIDRSKERRRRGDNLGRTFNLTYRKYLLEDEVIADGGQMFPEGSAAVPVSILDTVAEMADEPIRIGDVITFRIQGVPLKASVTSIRSRTKESFRPFFYFVFPEPVLEKAQQTAFTALRVAEAEISALQNRIVTAFPNITVINASESVAVITTVMKKLSNIIRFFMMFSVAAGVLIIISSILATRAARVREAVYYKVLGANVRFVLKVFTLENAFIGLISGFLAIGLAHAASWAVLTRVLNLPYFPLLGASTAMVAAAAAGVVIVGLLASRSILRQKPAGYLKQQTDE